MSKFIPQRKNANKHTQRGLKELENSIQRDGWIGAVTVAADGETFDGSARIETLANVMPDTEPIVVDVDGNTPVIVRRTDIPNADDPRAKRLAVAANRIAQVDLDWDANVLADLAQQEGDLLKGLFNDDELAELIGQGEPKAETVDAGELVDRAEELQKKWQCVKGDIWTAAGHYWICGDSRDFETWEKLLHAANVEKVNGVFTSPPYAEQRKTQYGGIPTNQYVEWWNELQANVRAHLANDGSFFVNIKPHCENGERVLYVFDLVLAMQRQWAWKFIDEFSWLRAGFPGGWPNRLKNQFEPVYHFSISSEIVFNPLSVGVDSDSAFDYSPDNTKNATAKNGNTWVNPKTKKGIARVGNVIDIKGNGGSTAQAASFPVGLPEFFIKLCSNAKGVWLDPFLGSGTTIIAAHQNGRRGLGIEFLEKYCAVICERVEKETGETPQRLES